MNRITIFHNQTHNESNVYVNFCQLDYAMFYFFPPISIQKRVARRDSTQTNRTTTEEKTNKNKKQTNIEKSRETKSNLQLIKQ